MHCLTEVSKDFDGKITVIRDRKEVCKSPGCTTLYAMYKLSAVVVPFTCDAVPELDGDIQARLEMYTKDDGEGRGYHIGRFQWKTVAAGTIQGRMRGTTNDGTHRGGEACDRLGHLEGLMEGDFVDGPFDTCSFIASYILNYDHGKEAQNSAIQGAIEGVRLYPCDVPS